MIVVIDYQTGNTGSVINMLKRIGAEAKLSADADEIALADKLILSGVGHFDSGMAKLRASGLLPAIERKVQVGAPILGICLGMQMLGQGSEEGSEPGLGWIQGRSVRFDFPDRSLKVPHMGWNRIQPSAGTGLFDDLAEDHRFYFVHSYHLVCDRPSDVVATSHYGHDFVAAVKRDNVFGTQFHPEKSHRFGMAVLRQFAATANC